MPRPQHLATANIATIKGLGVGNNFRKDIFLPCWSPNSNYVCLPLYHYIIMANFPVTHFVRISYQDSLEEVGTRTGQR